MRDVRLEGLKRALKQLNEEQRNLRQAEQQPDELLSIEEEAMLGPDKDSEIPSARRAISEKQREIAKEIEKHIAEHGQ